MTKQRQLRHIRLLSNNETIFEEVYDFLFVLIGEFDLRTVSFILQYHFFIKTSQKFHFELFINKLNMDSLKSILYKFNLENPPSKYP